MNLALNRKKVARVYVIFIRQISFFPPLFVVLFMNIYRFTKFVAGCWKQSYEFLKNIANEKSLNNVVDFGKQKCLLATTIKN